MISGRTTDDLRKRFQRKTAQTNDDQAKQRTLRCCSSLAKDAALLRCYGFLLLCLSCCGDALLDYNSRTLRGSVTLLEQIAKRRQDTYTWEDDLC
jgi:hypothetical protein